MMKKEFEINEILDAIDSINKTKKKKNKNVEKKDIIVKDVVLTRNKQVKSNKSDILVLNEMIE